MPLLHELSFFSGKTYDLPLSEEPSLLNISGMSLLRGKLLVEKAREVMQQRKEAMKDVTQEHFSALPAAQSKLLAKLSYM